MKYFYALVTVTGQSKDIPFTDKEACATFMELRRQQDFEVMVWWYERDGGSAGHSVDQIWRGSWYDFSPWGHKR